MTRTSQLPSATLPDDRIGQKQPLAIRTFAEVAEILGCSWTNVQSTERRAFQKLAENLDMQRLFVEIQEGGKR